MALKSLSGKIALVTGAGQNIGRGIALSLSASGAIIAVNGRDNEGLVSDTVAEIKKNGGNAVGYMADISDPISVKTLIDKIKSDLGGLDILICNAALNPFFGSSMDIPDDAFDKILNANIKSNHWLSNLVLPQMKERKDGSIIIISSIGGLKGSEMLGAYSISKAADMQLVRNIAVEHGPDNIRANCISPGIVKTRFAQALWDNPEILNKTTSRAPLRRIGEPDEIAGAAIYLSSEAGAFTTGQNIVIDGGVTIA